MLEGHQDSVKKAARGTDSPRNKINLRCWRIKSLVRTEVVVVDPPPNLRFHCGPLVGPDHLKPAQRGVSRFKNSRFFNIRGVVELRACKDPISPASLDPTTFDKITV